jgi:hypothetical protein
MIERPENVVYKQLQNVAVTIRLLAVNYRTGKAFHVIVRDYHQRQRMG